MVMGMVSAGGSNVARPKETLSLFPVLLYRLNTALLRKSDTHIEIGLILM